MDFSATTLWTSLFLIGESLGWFLLLLCFIEFPVFNASRVDPDKTPHSVASYLSLHCLQKSL